MTQAADPPCECPDGPGFCPRYRIAQEAHHVELCRKHSAYRRKWRLRLDVREGRTPAVALPTISRPEVVVTPAAPGLLRKAATLAAAVTRHVAHGLPAVPEAERDRRLAVCAACPDFRAARGTCARCGCRLKTKASWALETCPAGKWGPAPASMATPAPAGAQSGDAREGRP